MLTSVVVLNCVSIKLWWVRVEDAYHNSLCKPKSAHSPAAGKTVWRKSSDCKEVLSCRKQSEIKIYCFDWRLKLDENENQCLEMVNVGLRNIWNLKQNFNLCILVESVVAAHLCIIEDCDGAAWSQDYLTTHICCSCFSLGARWRWWWDRD